MNIDATAMQQGGIGAGYIHNIITQRLTTYLRRMDVDASESVNLVHAQDVQSEWRLGMVHEHRGHHQPGALLTVVLTGAAVIREREHGTLEHLLVMPLTAFEIAMAKVLANSLVILVATRLSLFLVVRMVLKVPFAGSVLLWFTGVLLYLFFATALGIFLGTISRSMAQFALLIILVIMVLMLLSGGARPSRASRWLQYVTYFLPARHFVSFSQVIIYRGGGLRRRVAPVRDGRADRAGVLRLQPDALPQVDRGDEIAGSVVRRIVMTERKKTIAVSSQS